MKILDKRADLGHGDVKKLLFSLSVPTITSQIVNMLYNLVDRVFIGHMQPAETVGKLALTGVGVCLPIIMVISAFASLIAIGGAPRASIAEGAGESEKSERIMGNCLTMLVITALGEGPRRRPHGAGADGAVRVLCRAAFTDVRREREHHRLRA